MSCRDCVHYLSSVDAAKPRPGLVGYGYCKAAPSVEGRARFFHDSQAVCWLPGNKFTPVKREAV